MLLYFLISMSFSVDSFILAAFCIILSYGHATSGLVFLRSLKKSGHVALNELVLLILCLGLLVFCLFALVLFVYLGFLVVWYFFFR